MEPISCIQDLIPFTNWLSNLGSGITIFKDTKLLSVNQINAQIKLLEVWKSKNFQAYPI